LATTPLLSIGAKLTLLREPWIRRRDDRREESVEEFAVRRFGREVHDVLVAPMISGIFAGDTTRLSLQSVFPRLAELEAEHGSVVWGFFAEAMGGRAKSRAGPKGRTLISFREGLETLPRRLGERLGRNIRLNCAVERIERSGGEGGLDLGVRERGGERRISAAATVVATSVDAASRLIGSLAPVGAAALQAFELPPLASVSVAYSKNDVPRDLTGFGFLVPRTEDIRLLGCLWGSSLFSGRAPEGFVTLTCFLGGSTAPDLARLDEQATIDIVRDDLRRALGVTALPRVLAVERHARAIPQYTIGHRERVASVRQAVASVPGLFLTGNYLEGISVGDCVSQARQTAEAVKRYVSLCASA
jgi:oxygen-dependent protoporphyrinogen oxidase